MKKKLLTLVLALTMVLSMSMTAMAEEGPTPITSFNKVYENDYVAEELTFEVEAVGANKDVAPSVTVGENNNYTVTGMQNEIAIAVGDTTNTTPGVYTYKITETEGKTQGVSYNTAEDNVVVVQVLVTNDGKATVYQAKLDEQTAKNDTIKNKYQTGTLTVTKEIMGNMIQDTDEFTIEVTFTNENNHEALENITWKIGEVSQEDITAAELNKGTVKKDVTLKGGETVTFENIPYNVTYTVKETTTGYTTVYSGTDILNGTEQTFDNGEKVASARADSLENGIMDNAAETVTVTNYKYQSVDTGIIVNNLPYILVLAGVAVAAVVLFRKKRYSAM